MPLLLLRRLSGQCTLAIAFVFLSGLCNSWLITEGQWAPLRSSAWGALLMTKIVFVLIALAIGYRNRRDLQGNQSPDISGSIAQRIRLEAFVMLVILCTSARLSNLSPG